MRQAFSATALFSIALVMIESTCLSAIGDDAATTQTSGAVEAVTLREGDLTESSGLAISQRTRQHFWSHNDSGGSSRIFAFDRTGRKTGQCRLQAAAANDWEDMASFVVDGVSRLLVADCGDNQSKRDSITIYLLDEPDPQQSTVTNHFQTLEVTYSDGPRNCEAVCVDTVRDRIILVAKSRLPAAGIYLIALPEPDGGRQQVTAQRVGTVALPMITAMDLDPTSGDIWLVSYFHGFRFACGDRTEPVGQQFSRLAETFELPRWKQIEAVAVAEPGSVWVTTEGSPALLGRVKVPSTKNASQHGTK